MKSQENSFESKKAIFGLNLNKISTKVMQIMAEKLKYIPNATIQEIIKTAGDEISRLEKVGNYHLALKALTPEIAKNIVALWVFSGPGSYDGPDKDDRYKHLPWSRKMEHDRLNYTALLSRKISESIYGESAKSGPISQAEKRRGGDKKTIAQFSPTIIYNGNTLENNAVKEILSRPGIIIPNQKVFIPDTKIKDTLDQIKTFSLPENLHFTGKEIGIISHAPHCVRLMHMLNEYQTIPKDMRVRLFPIETPLEGKQEYAELETMGLLYAISVGNAKKEPYPYTIHGES